MLKLKNQILKQGVMKAISRNIYKLPRCFRKFIIPLELHHLPRVFYIEPTNHCNLRCIMCPQARSSREKGYMEFPLFQKIVKEVPDNSFIHLFMGGESLLHPKIIEMIRYIKEVKPATQCRIATNGTLLDENMSKKIILSGLDFISFSFDGPDKETYEKIRRGANYEKVLQNIINFLRLKQELKSKKPYVSLEIIRMKHTEGNINKFIQKFANLPVDEILVKKFLSWGGLIDTTTKKRQFCIAPWANMTILWDGSVVPCCVDYDKRYLIGNVRESSLFELFNNDKMKFLRKSILDNQFEKIKLCRNCYGDIEAMYNAYEKRLSKNDLVRMRKRNNT